jgi:hypothetical protein
MAKASRKKVVKKAVKKMAKKAGRKTARRTAAHVKHINALAKANPAFKRLVAKYGMPKPTVRQAHVAFVARAGEICLETDCVDGKKFVVRRDAAGDCSDFSEVSC